MSASPGHRRTISEMSVARGPQIQKRLMGVRRDESGCKPVLRSAKSFRSGRSLLYGPGAGFPVVLVQQRKATGCARLIKSGRGGKAAAAAGSGGCGWWVAMGGLLLQLSVFNSQGQATASDRHGLESHESPPFPALRPCIPCEAFRRGEGGRQKREGPGRPTSEPFS